MSELDNRVTRHFSINMPVLTARTKEAEKAIRILCGNQEEPFRTGIKSRTGFQSITFKDDIEGSAVTELLKVYLDDPE